MSKKILDIAIVGISCKFAGANNVQELWKNLKNGVESVKPIPNERWEQEEYFSGKKGKYIALQVLLLMMFIHLIKNIMVCQILKRDF